MGELSNDQDDEIGIVPPLAYFVSGNGSSSCLFCQWEELSNDHDNEIGMAPLLLILLVGKTVP